MKYFQTLEQRIVEKIQNIARQLESSMFISNSRRKKFYKEIENLVKEREQLRKVLESLFPNEKYR